MRVKIFAVYQIMLTVAIFSQDKITNKSGKTIDATIVVYQNGLFLIEKDGKQFTIPDSEIKKIVFSRKPPKPEPDKTQKIINRNEDEELEEEYINKCIMRAKSQTDYFMREYKEELKGRYPRISHSYGGTYSSLGGDISGGRQRRPPNKQKAAEFLKQAKKCKALGFDWEFLNLAQGGMGLIEDVEVMQVVDKENFICKWRQDTIWISNYSTENLVDGKSDKLNKLFRITGTKTYATAIGGTNTIHKVEAYERSFILSRLKKTKPEVYSQLTGMVRTRTGWKKEKE